MTEVENLLNDLQNLGDSKVLLGKSIMPEDEFYILLTRLKKWVATEKIEIPNLTPVQKDAIAKIDQLELLIQNSKHVLGSCFVNQQSYNEHIKQLREERTLRGHDAELTELASIGIPFLNFLKINQEQFYITIVKLKKRVASVIAPNFPTTDPFAEDKKEVCKAIDELEKLACDSKAILDKIIIPRSDYFQKLQVLTTAVLQLQKARKR